MKFTYNVSLHLSTEKALFKVIYVCISQSDMLTAEKVTKYSVVNEITIETEQLTIFIISDLRCAELL